MSKSTGSHIEMLALVLLQGSGWKYVHGPSIAPGAEMQERQSFEQLILTQRLTTAIQKINPGIPATACDQVIREITCLHSAGLLQNNKTFHSLLINNSRISYRDDGHEQGTEVSLIDFDNWENNEFLAVNQYTVIENQQEELLDILLFVNGIPLVLIELKNAGDTHKTMNDVYEQVQVYKTNIPSLFTYNIICVLLDGQDCLAGSIFENLAHFKACKTIDGKKEVAGFIPQFEVLIKGMLNPKMLLDLVRNVQK